MPWHDEGMEGTNHENRPAQPAWFFWTWLALMFFATVGLSFRSLVDAGVLCAFCIGFWLNETRVLRPARSFCRLTLGSALLFLFLVIEVGSWGGDFTMGAVMWLGVTVLGAIWTIHYERSDR